MLGTRHCAHNKRGVNSCPPSVKRPTEALGLVGHQGASVRGNAKVSVLMELLPPLEKGSDPTPGHDSFTWMLGLAGACNGKNADGTQRVMGWGRAQRELPEEVVMVASASLGFDYRGGN